MSVLRRPVRKLVEGSATVYAIVESVYLDKAAVRLATNGARLTGLDIVSHEINVGDRVAVEYSAEGKPYIRSLPSETVPDSITLTTDQPVVELPTESEVPANESLLVARFTNEDVQTETCGYTSSTSNNQHTANVAWDFTVYNLGGYSVDEGQITLPRAGRYMFFWSVAVGPPPKIRNRDYDQHWMRMALTNFPGSRTSALVNERWIYSGTDNVYGVHLSGSAIYTYYPDEWPVVLRVYPTLTYGWEYGKDPATWEYEILQSFGQYPLLDIYCISDIGTGPKAHAYWWN